MKIQHFLVCLGAGVSQVSLIQTAKSFGYNVIATDQDENAPGFEFSDYKIIESTHDFNSIIKSIIAIKENFGPSELLTGILTRSSGPPVISAAHISNYFNLPGVPVLSAAAIVNKDLLRKKSSQLGIITPDYQLINTDNFNIRPHYDYPVVVKPALSMVGKSGISVVRDKQQLVKALEYAKNNTINRKIIVEKYLSGSDYCMIGFIDHGRIYKVCILEEINIEDKNGLISGRGFKTHNPSKDVESQIDLISKKIVTGLDIKRSPFMASFRSDDDGKLYLIEIHLDIGGDTLIENLFPSALNVDFKEISVKMAAGSMNLPLNIIIKPAAIIFEKGSEIVSKKKCKIIMAETYKKLDLLINAEK